MQISLRSIHPVTVGSKDIIKQRDIKIKTIALTSFKKLSDWHLNTISTQYNNTYNASLHFTPSGKEVMLSLPDRSSQHGQQIMRCCQTSTN